MRGSLESDVKSAEGGEIKSYALIKSLKYSECNQMHSLFSEYRFGVQEEIWFVFFQLTKKEA
jgi:hypothetical protein